MVFGPDGLLYVSAFSEPDPTLGWILSYNTSTGAVRVVASTGAVRRYDVSTKTFTNIVAPGGPLVSGWGLTFGHTNPTTLAYPSS